MPRSAAVLRPRAVSSETTRRTILAAAEALLAAHGEGGLSIRELCLRAGVTAPTVYHHFGDKRGLVDRVVNDCFAAFDRALGRRRPPTDPVAALTWSFDRYLEYGLRHPAHYRLMFQPHDARRTPAGLAAYDRLRRMVAAVAQVGRLGPPVEDATAACWAAAHGVTSLVIAGYLARDAAAIGIVRGAMMARIATDARPPAPPGRGRTPAPPRSRARARARGGSSP